MQSINMPPAGARLKPQPGAGNFYENYVQQTEYLSIGNQFDKEYEQNRSLITNDVNGQKKNQYGQVIDFNQAQIMENYARQGDSLITDSHQFHAPWKGGIHKNILDDRVVSPQDMLLDTSIHGSTQIVNAIDNYNQKQQNQQGRQSRMMKSDPYGQDYYNNSLLKTNNLQEKQNINFQDLSRVQINQQGLQESMNSPYNKDLIHTIPAATNPLDDTEFERLNQKYNSIKQLNHLSKNQEYELNKRNNSIAAAMAVSSHRHVDLMEQRLQNIQSMMEGKDMKNIPDDLFAQEVTNSPGTLDRSMRLDHQKRNQSIMPSPQNYSAKY